MTEKQEIAIKKAFGLRSDADVPAEIGEAYEMMQRARGAANGQDLPDGLLGLYALAKRSRDRIVGGSPCPVEELIMLTVIYESMVGPEIETSGDKSNRYWPAPNIVLASETSSTPSLPKRRGPGRPRKNPEPAAI